MAGDQCSLSGSQCCLLACLLLYIVHLAVQHVELAAKPTAADTLGAIPPTSLESSVWVSPANMTGRITDETAPRYLDFLSHRLLHMTHVPMQHLHQDHRKFAALSETEKPMHHDVWMWADDNAKAIEAFSVTPNMFARYHDVVESLLHFITSMSPAGFPIPLRREVEDVLIIHRMDANDFAFHTALISVHGDLTTGTIVQGVRFHDARAAYTLQYSGHTVRFEFLGRQFSVPVSKRFITNTALHIESDSKGAHGVVLSYSVVLGADGDHVGTVLYRFHYQKHRVHAEIDITVKPVAGVTLQNVHVSFAVDNMDDPKQPEYDTLFVAKAPYASPEDHYTFGATTPQHVEFDRVVSGPGDGRLLLETACSSDTNLWNQFSCVDPAEFVRWTAFSHAHNPMGDSCSAFLLYEQPRLLSRITSSLGSNTRFHWVEHWFALGDASQSELHINMTVLAVQGTVYTHMEMYDRLLQQYVNGRYEDIDMSITYDPGVILNAFAVYVMRMTELKRSGRMTWKPTFSMEEAMQHFDTLLNNYLQYFFPDGTEYVYVYDRSLMLTLLACDKMYRATENKSYLKPIIKTLLPGVFSRWKRFHFNNFDVLGAAVLALSRAYHLLPDQREEIKTYITAMLDDVETDAQSPATVTSEHGGRAFDRVSRDNYYWNFKGALWLRAIHELRNLPGAEQWVGPQYGEKLQLMESSITDYISTSTRSVKRQGSTGDSLLEAKTCFRCGETNSETQSWVVTGLHVHPVL